MMPLNILTSICVDARSVGWSVSGELVSWLVGRSVGQSVGWSVVSHNFLTGQKFFAFTLLSENLFYLCFFSEKVTAVRACADLAIPAEYRAL